MWGSVWSGFGPAMGSAFQQKMNNSSRSWWGRAGCARPVGPLPGWGDAVAGWAGVGGVDGGEFGADGVGVGVLEVGEDGQGLLVGVAGGLGVAGGALGVAEVDEAGRFPVAFATVVVFVDGLLVAVDGLGVVAEVVVGVAEAVPGGGS